MKAEPLQIGDVLKDPRRFIVPIYQRTYAWTRARQLEKFFDSVEAKAMDRLGDSGPSYPHYMGALLLSLRGKFTFGAIPIFDVVDGQQRLTTYQLFLAALRDLGRAKGFSSLANQLTTYLVNADTPIMKDPKTERYKLHSTSYDRAIFRTLVDLDLDGIREKYAQHFFKNGNIRESAPLPLRAWWFFWEESSTFIEGGLPDETYSRFLALSSAVLEDFRVIVITLDESDDAQVIFETLNSGGEPLAAMDLVRNDVFHRAIRQGEDPDALMESRWGLFEEAFWKEDATQGRIRKPRIDFFLAHVLAAESGKEVLLSELYSHYKAFVVSRSFKSVDEELELLLRHTPTYRKLVQPSGNDALADLARELQVFDVTTAYPLIFVIADSDADEEVKSSLYRLISSYIVRRALCGLTAKGYNLTFLRLAATFRAEGVSVSTFSQALAHAEGDSVKFPTNDELFAAITTRPQYTSLQTSRLNFILRQMERASRNRFDEGDWLPTGLTIEHVLPEDWAEYWPLPSGAMAPADYLVPGNDDRWQEIERRQSVKQTLGNLTLLTLPNNSRLGKLPFSQRDSKVGQSKRDALRTSLLKMNHEIAEHEHWDEERILERSKWLAGKAKIIWPHPVDLM